MVNVLTLKKDTVPKSDKHSIDTKANPAIIAGLADGKIILKNVNGISKISKERLAI